MKKALPLGIALVAVALGSSAVLAAHGLGDRSHLVSQTSASSVEVNQVGTAEQSGDQGQTGESGQTNQSGDQSQTGEAGQANQSGDQGQHGEVDQANQLGDQK